MFGAGADNRHVRISLDTCSVWGRDFGGRLFCPPSGEIVAGGELIVCKFQFDLIYHLSAFDTDRVSKVLSIVVSSGNFWLAKI